ncbi:uncharacterized protein BX663DRAFT_502301 [Cokeromyces recurvatus]|uniref:uncharacterized protein n=1 Tax=Cokeromyces recurvatus TaxID=90255 RepID=UPI00221EDE53|nr:uncharacterized protein BX663DRAFT_502301 [Cokeromyces recurvatus]KAI7905271.1 hypothetical protein BX663DRAFT_502301 [Cokeromyces recurvatus]
MKFYILLSALFIAVNAQVRSPTYLYNVTSPKVNAPYVASQALPCIYDIADNATSDNLQLSIVLTGSNDYYKVLTASADISQGFSFRKEIDGATVYEHQFNYNIPSNTTAGDYIVAFVDGFSQTNVSIPITIGAAPKTPSSTALASGTASSVPSSSTTSFQSIYNQINSANTTHVQHLSKLLLLVTFIFTLIQFF